MRDWAEPPRGDVLRTIAVARLVMPEVNIQAPPNLSDPDYEELLDAGINDWRGLSPVTPGFLNPDRPGPHSAETAPCTHRKGIQVRQPRPVHLQFLHPSPPKTHVSNPT